jgi:hypothetical protein
MVWKIGFTSGVLAVFAMFVGMLAKADPFKWMPRILVVFGAPVLGCMLWMIWH